MKMKKMITLLLALLMVVGMTACGKKKEPEWYGHYVTTELHDLTGTYSDEVLVSVLEAMREENSLFEMELGEECKMLNPDGQGGFTEIPMTLDMDNKLIVNASDQEDKITFDFVDGKFILVDEASGIQFIMEKTEN